MGITAIKWKAKISDSFGKGSLFVFFPEDDHGVSTDSAPVNAKLAVPSKRVKACNRRCSSSIMTRAQSTISVCVLSLFLTVILFIVSTFEPTFPPLSSRRLLSDSHFPNRRFTPVRNQRWFGGGKGNTFSPALQRMGRLHLRGTRAMQDLAICHVPEGTTVEELKLFLRVLQRSGFTSKADIVILFPSSHFSVKFMATVEEEIDYFVKLATLHKDESEKELNNTKHDGFHFDVGRFLRSWKKEVKEPLWGKKTGGNVVNVTDTDTSGDDTNTVRMSYGSVVSFDANELDPENSLAGFIDHIAMSLRRWACYPMLLGRIRRNFKHVILVDVKKSLVLGDPLARVRNLRTESVLLTLQRPETKPGKKISDRAQSQVSSAVVMGGSRGVRRLANSMLTEIVRVAMQHKKKNLLTGSGVLNRLAGNKHLVKNIDLVEFSEPLPDESILVGSNSSLRDQRHHYPLIQRQSGNYDLNSVIMNRICAYNVDSLVYIECRLSNTNIEQ